MGTLSLLATFGPLGVKKIRPRTTAAMMAKRPTHMPEPPRVSSSATRSRLRISRS